MFFILMTHSEISFSYDYFKGIDNCNFDISPMFLNKSLHDHISDLVSDETMFTYDLYLPLHFWIETDCTAWSEISCILFLIEYIIGTRGQSMDCVHDYLDWINANAFRCSSGGPCCQSFFLYFA